MYSFAQRANCKVFDEPFYGRYLLNNGLNHPGRQEVLNDMSTKTEEIWRAILAEGHHSECFVKNMAHHIQDDDKLNLQQTKMVLLIRDPAKTIHSYTKVLEGATLNDIGIKQQWELYNSPSIHPKIVVDSSDILAQPEFALSKLCKHLKIDFQKNMLSWNTGPRDFDGVWAKHWYGNVHKSRGFSKNESKDTIPVKPENRALLDEANWYYQQLVPFKI